jgi:hypothetical protein
MRMALKLGINIALDEIRADEFMAMQILEQEYEKHEREKLPGNHGE